MSNQKNKHIREWDFGPDTVIAQHLEDLVITGKKTATCGLYSGDAPEVGDMARIIKSDGSVLCCIKYVKVEVKPLAQVDREFIKDEGEGIASIPSWLTAHLQTFRRWNRSAEINEYSLAVFEQFTVIQP